MKCTPVDSLEVAEKAQPVVEYIESRSEYSFDEDVVDALILLSIQPAQSTSPSSHEVCSFDSADRLDNNLNDTELMPDHPSRPKENRLPIVYSRKRFRKKKDDGYLISVADRLQIQDSDKEDVLIECKIDPKNKMWSIGNIGEVEPGVDTIPRILYSIEFTTLFSS